MIDRDKIPYLVTQILKGYYGDMDGESRYEKPEWIPKGWEVAVDLGYLEYEYWIDRHILTLTESGRSALNDLYPFQGSGWLWLLQNKRAD